VWETVRQWRLFHPAAGDANPLYLVLGDGIARDELVRANASAHHVNLISAGELAVGDPAWAHYRRVFYIQGYMHPGGNRKTGNQHFNQLVTERFLALEAVMRLRGLRHVVHLENDVMPYANFAPFVSRARACGYGMLATTPHVKGVIPGTVYVRDAAELHRLNGFINELLSCGPGFGKALQPGYANDMTYLRNYYELFGASALGNFPVWRHAEGENCMSLSAPSLSLSESGTISDEDATKWEWLFDAASFGQWYSFQFSKTGEPVVAVDGVSGASSLPHPAYPGADNAALSAHAKRTAQAREVVAKGAPPKNVQQSMKGRFIDATPLPYLIWTTDEAGRRVPVLPPPRKGQAALRLATLHIHAKNLHWFRSA